MTAPTTAPTPATPGTPLAWRAAVAAAIVLLTFAAYQCSGELAPRLQSLLGVGAFVLVAVLFSENVRAINWRVVGVGLALQVGLALLIVKVPAVFRAVQAVGDFVEKFSSFTDGPRDTLFGTVWPRTPLALIILPTVVFIASVFAVLFHLKVLQYAVRVLSRGIVLLLGRRGASGAETLSTVANIFMGQTEAPLIVAPYVAKMTRSELLCVMVGGMATVAGGVLVIYISMGASVVALLATSVMAAPCTLYVSKMLIPETEVPETRGTVTTADDDGYANAIDAAAGGASEGMKLAVNIIAMLIAFLALIAMTDYFLGQLAHVSPRLEGVTLSWIFGNLFSPVAVLMGVEAADVPRVGELLGVKLVANEFVAFDIMTTKYRPGMADGISERSYQLATYALTGFANIGSIGIQLGGIGCLPRDPADQQKLRARLAKLGPVALLGGFLATLINAAIAGVIL